MKKITPDPFEKKIRLNPFIFPSETDFRFVLLVLAVLGASLFLWNSLAATLLTNSGEMQEVYKSCERDYPHPNTSDFPFDLGIKDPVKYEEIKQAIDANYACAYPIRLKQGAIQSGGILLLIILTFGLFWGMPIYIIKHNQLSQLNSEDDPELYDTLQQLSKEAGLITSPKYVLNIFDNTTGGTTFGRPGQAYVSLSAGLIKKFIIDPQYFRATLLHELSHFTNGDVYKTYFSLSLFAIFSIFAILLFVTYAVEELIKQQETNLLILQLLSFTLRLSIASGIVYAALTRILRVREYFADLRGTELLKEIEPMWNTLHQLSANKSTRLRQLFRVHPLPKERQLVLIQPQRMFGLTLLDGVLVGIVVTIAYGNVQKLLALLSPPSWGISWTWGVAILLFAPFIIGAIGLGIWRGAFSTIWSDYKPQNGALLGLGLGLGLSIGHELEFFNLILQNSVIYRLLWSILLCAICYLFGYWVDICAKLWLHKASNLVQIQRFYRLGLLITGSIMSVWLTSLLRLGDLEELLPFITIFLADGVFGWHSLYSINGLSVFIAITAILIWFFPLIAVSLKKQDQDKSSNDWMLLAESTQPLHTPVSQVSRLRFFILLGIINGCIYLCILLFARAYLHVAVDPETRALDQFAFIFSSSQYLVALILFCVSVFIVALVNKNLGWVYGLFTGFISMVAIAFCNNLIGEMIDCFPIFSIRSIYGDCYTVDIADFLSRVLFDLEIIFFISLTPGIILVVLATFIRYLIRNLIGHSSTNSSYDQLHI